MRRGQSRKAALRAEPEARIKSRVGVPRAERPHEDYDVSPDVQRVWVGGDHEWLGLGRMKGKPASRSISRLAHWMDTGDANSAGNIHGGTVMKMADEAAGLAAIRHSRRRVVTAGMDRMTFLVPILVGELVTFSATVNAAWRTSMEIGVRVEAENPFTGEVRHTNTAYLTMVALDDDGRPAPVPQLIATTAAEQRRMREAELRRANRLAERAEILTHRERER